jgi:hypothetical protein
LTNSNNIYFKDVKKYLIFSLTSLTDLTNQELNNNQIDDQLAYSLKLIVVNFINKGLENNNKPLYNNILNYIKLNYNLIKEGGEMDIFFVSSNLENNVIKESLEIKDNNNNYDKQGILLPSFQEKINLNNNSKNNILTINLYIFSYDSFFKKFLNTTSVSKFNRIKNNTKM